MSRWTFRKSLNEALRTEMLSDPEVFVFGLDVDDHKALFGSTENILRDFGSDRIFGTPLSEDAMTGFAIGASLRGKKPIHIHIRADFALLAVNQLVNMASNIHYLTAGNLNVPITIRAIIGRGWGQGLQHSKSVHSLFSHFPGLKVVMPSSPQDAYSLLRRAIQDPNPVLFLEHRWLYDVEGEVDINLKSDYTPARVREGNDITIVANSWMTIEALKAHEVLNSAGISAEVFDLRGISPLELGSIIESVKRTKHCIVVDHDWVEFGLAAELVARIQEAAFHDLKKPVRRLGFRPVPCPTSRPLENKFYPRSQEIIGLACELLERETPDLSKHEFYSYESRFRGPF
jgi:pyruvate dehydrogenase E1 component beta subunit